MSFAQKILVGGTRQYLKELKYAPVEKMIHLLVHKDRQAAWIGKYHQWRSSRHPLLQQQLRSIVTAHPEHRAVIVFLPSLDWRRQLFQRPQQMALALAKRGALVFYTQLAQPPGNDGFTPIDDRLFVCTLPLDLFSTLSGFFVYSLTWNRKYLLKFHQPNLIYDYVDDVAAFDGDAVQLSKDHLALLGEADIVSTTARLLYEEAKKSRQDALLVPNGVDFAHFQPGQVPPQIPQDIAGLSQEGKPIVGYYGALANWFDFSLMLNLAKKRADLNFILIGTKHDDSLDASGLLRQTNVTYLGPKDYAELPAYLSCMDVAILPFQVNRVTQATSPLKLFEYCAGGKPVVATPLNEVMRYPEILIGKDSQQFSQKIDEALALKNDIVFIHKLQQIGVENTWEMRAEQILQAIERRNADQREQTLSKVRQ